MVNKANSFKKYPWAYFGSVQTSRKYIETLQIDSAKNKEDLVRGSEAANIKSIDTTRDDGTSGGRVIFSEEQQFDLFCQAYYEFCNSVDFEELKKYFSGLIPDVPDDEINLSHGRKKRK